MNSLHEKINLTDEEWMAVSATLKFIQKKFYNEEDDKTSNTYKTLITIRDKIINAQ